MYYFHTRVEGKQ